MTDSAPEVSVRMSQETLDALAASGCFLYGLSAVRSADGAGRPAPWLQTDKYAMHTRVQLPRELLAFTSPRTPPLLDGVRVEPGFHVPARAGQTLVAGLAGGGGEMREWGAADAISLLNTTAGPLTGGLACTAGGEATPLYVAPLHGGWLQIVVPLPKLLLFVSPYPAPPGTVVATSTGPGVLVTFTPGAECALEFDADQGWSWPQGVRAHAVPAQSDLVRLLVEYPAPDGPAAGAG